MINQIMRYSLKTEMQYTIIVVTIWAAQFDTEATMIHVI